MRFNFKLTTILLSSVCLVLLSIQPSFASTLSPTLSAGANTVDFRDITVLSGFTPTLVMDSSPPFRVGTSVSVTVTDPSANVDLTTEDTTNLNVGSDLVPIPENGPNTGVFLGSVPVTFGPIDISYTGLPSQLGRAQINIDAGTPGTAIVSDVTFPDGTCIAGGTNSIPWAQVSQAIDIEPGTATINQINSLTFSYADIPAATGGDPGNLVIVYRPDSSSGFLKVDESVNTDVNLGPGLGPVILDSVGMTVYVDNAILATAQGIGDTDVYSATPTLPSGQYMLAMEGLGCGGGGSSGIVSAGFVLNLLAGSSTFDSSHVSPPTFGGTYNHYTDGLTITQGSQKTIFDTSNYNQDIPTQVMISGKKVDMDFKTFEAYNPNGVIHMGLYIIPHGQDMITSNSIGSIIYDKNSPVQISDPNHILSDATASISLDGKFQHTAFSFVPTKSYDKMSFLARAWNDHLQTTDIRVHDAIDQPAAPKILPAGVIQYDTFDSLQAAVEKDGFYKSPIMAHIHGTTDVFSSDEGGQVYWLYDTINHNVTLVIADKNGNEIYSDKAALDNIVQDKKGDYGFMQFTSTQLNRDDKHQEENAMKIEEAKALLLALEQGIIKPNN